jgi:hypothetical protein
MHRALRHEDEFTMRRESGRHARAVTAARTMLTGRVLAIALALALAGASRAVAAPPLQPVSPFDMIGFLQAARLGGSGPVAGTDLLAGGTLTVNGQTVVVPRNAIVQLPATFLTWQELFALAPPPYGLTATPQTGLAMTDVPTPITTYEVHVQGNRVGDQYIAGLITIAQQSLNAGQGFVNFIDYTTGELRVGGKIGDPTSGQRVRVNDPLGRFGRASSPDPRFTIDEDNPNIRTETGYPMCVPRFDPAVKDDPDCPQGNRPADGLGGFQKIFTMNPAGTTTFLDPTKMAPFEIGDFVTYSGTLVKEGPEPTAGPLTTLDKTYVAAWTIVANVGLFTTPGTDPVYVAIDVSILGVGGVAAPGLPQEATIRTRFEGFATDYTRAVDLFGVDVDPCTGAETERAWGAIDVDVGPPTGAVLGRWRFRPPTKILSLPPAGTFLPATREMYARIRGATHPVAANGLTTGQYRAPIAEYLFPENLGIGNPPVPLNLQDFPFLAKGVGPWVDNGAVVGQLQPWPGGAKPTAPSCAPPVLNPPVADAGHALSAFSGELVKLDGTASVDLNGFPLTYAWTQVSGPQVILSSAAAARPSFTAPGPAAGVTAPTDLVFSLVVSDAAGVSQPATVTVSVDPGSGVTLAPIADAGADQTVSSNALVLLDGTKSLDPNVPALGITYAWSQASGPNVTLTASDTARPTFRAPIVSAGNTATLVFTLTVTNSAVPVPLGAAASVTVTVGPPLAPIADAGANQAALAGSNVTLDGTASNDPNGLPLTYQWTQVAGPPVALLGSNAATPVFTAPPQPPGTPAITIAFILTVNNGYVSSLGSLVTVSVVSGTDTVTVLSAVYRAGKQRLTVTAASNALDAILTLDSIAPGVAPQQFTLVGGVLTVDLIGVAQPSSVTVTSSLGGTATGFLTRIR